MTGLTHIDETGAARMVDVSGKAVTRRSATAVGSIRMGDAALAAVRAGSGPKGEVLQTARIAGIMAAKQTSTLIPMCHPLAISSVKLDFAVESGAITATALVTIEGKTGVEMEALTAVSVALLTIYDMVKALDKSCVIDGIRLIAKSGGKSGDWAAT